MARKPTIVRFPEWMPDRAPYIGGALLARNLIPKGDAWQMMPGPSIIGGRSLTDIPLRLVAVKSSAGNAHTLALGANGVSRYVAGQWEVPPGGARPSASWASVVWGDKAYAVNGVDPMLAIDLLNECATNEVATMPDGLTGLYLDIVADQLVIGNCRQNRGSTEWPFRVWASGIGRPETFVPDASISSTYQDVSDIGKISGIIGGEFGIVLGFEGYSRMDFIGGSDIFAFRTIEQGTGCIYPATAARLPDRAVWFSERGFVSSSGGPSTPIGENRVNEWFRARVTRDNQDQIKSSVFHSLNLLMYLLPPMDGAEDREVLCYCWAEGPIGKWSHGRMSASIIGEAVARPQASDDASFNFTGADIAADAALSDAIDYLSDNFRDGDAFPAALVGGRLAAMVPGTLQAEIETPEYAPIEGAMTRLVRARPLVHSSGKVQLMHSVRDDQSSEATRKTGWLNRERVGTVVINRKGRYHRTHMLLEPPFKDVIGLELSDVKLERF